MIFKKKVFFFCVFLFFLVFPLAHASHALSYLLTQLPALPPLLFFFFFFPLAHASHAQPVFPSSAMPKAHRPCRRQDPPGPCPITPPRSQPFRIHSRGHEASLFRIHSRGHEATLFRVHSRSHDPVSTS